MTSYQKRTAISHYILKHIARPVLKRLWVKKVVGLENIPKTGSYIFALNHQSFFDFLIFTVVCPRNIHFLAAEKFFSHRYWKILMKLTGQIKVDRHAEDKSVVHEHVKKHLEKGLLLGIFPEGTRSPYRDEMLPAFSGIAKYALKHNVSVIPVGLRGMYDILSKESKKVSFKKVCEVHVGEPIDLTKHFFEGHEDDKHLYLTEKIIKRIEILSGKKYNHYKHTHE